MIYLSIFLSFDLSRVYLSIHPSLYIIHVYHIKYMESIIAAIIEVGNVRPPQGQPGIMFLQHLQHRASLLNSNN